MRNVRERIGTVLLAALLAGGCGGDGLTDVEREAFGAYTLTAINGTILPFALTGRPCGERAERGFLELAQENRFYVEVDISKPSCPGESERTWVGTGIWTVIDGKVRLVSDPRNERAVQFAAAAAPLLGGGLDASGRFEGEGFQSASLTFTFTLNQ
jgi:hypothetical protein